MTLRSWCRWIAAPNCRSALPPQYAIRAERAAHVHARAHRGAQVGTRRFSCRPRLDRTRRLLHPRSRRASSTMTASSRTGHDGSGLTARLRLGGSQGERDLLPHSSQSQRQTAVIHGQGVRPPTRESSLVNTQIAGALGEIRTPAHGSGIHRRFGFGRNVGRWSSFSMPAVSVVVWKALCRRPNRT